MLRNTCAGTPLVDEKIEIAADGQFTRRFDLRENDVWLVELRPL